MYTTVCAVRNTKSFTSVHNIHANATETCVQCLGVTLIIHSGAHSETFDGIQTVGNVCCLNEFMRARGKRAC